MRKVIGNRAFYLSAGIQKVGYVQGDNSLQKDGLHTLMWDFDEQEPAAVMVELAIIQLLHDLSTIYILDTQKEFGTSKRNLHARCYTALPWKEAFRIVEDTELVCPMFLKLSHWREYFTLRFSDKGGRKIEPYATLKGDDSRAVEPEDSDNFVSYLTKIGGK